MRADFLDAHERHFRDAEYLFLDQRFANADHLYGMAAECGLKQLMLIFGMPFDYIKDMPGQSIDRVHVNEIWIRFESYRCGHYQGTGYVLPQHNPFDDWNVSQRYAHQSNFDAALATAHQEGATLVSDLVKKAMLEGLL
jgi:hypothetical protein